MDRIESLKLFKLVAETESFTKAAELSRLPRSTVSAVIQKLETSHQVQLFHRTTRSVRLTEDGLTLLRRSQSILAEMDDIESLFKQNQQEISGRVKIDVPSRIASRVIAPALPDFLRQYPNIEVELGATDRAIDLIQEGVDCVLRVGKPISSSLIARPIGHFEMKNCASPDYLERYGLPQTIEELTRHWVVGYVSPTTGKMEPWEYVKAKQLQTLTLKSRIMVNHADTYIACALSGLGLIQIPAFDVLHHLALGELVEVLQNARAQPMPVYILYPHRKHLTPRVRVFIAWLEQLISGLAREQSRA